MERILIIMTAGSWEEASPAVLSAMENAVISKRLTFGLLLPAEPDAEAAAAMASMGVRYTATRESAWTAGISFWQGENKLLLGCSAMAFEPRWDAVLLRCLRELPSTDNRAVLTGHLPEPDDAVNAVSAVAASRIKADGTLFFRKGTALNHAAKAVPAVLLHPSFCFGPSAFFREVAQAGGIPFLAADELGWSLYTLHKPVIRLDWPMPVSPENVLRDSRWDEYAYRCHIEPDIPLPPAFRTGIAVSDLTFPMALPPKAKLQEKLAFSLRRSSHPTPLFVSARLRGCMPPDASEEELLHRFRHLAKLENIPLLCFADQGVIRPLTSLHPNVLEFRPHYGLPISGDLHEGEGPDFLGLSVPFLLNTAREKYLNQSHCVWIDFDYCRVPLSPGFQPDWSQLCRDRIVMAWVGGEPDPSMISVPEFMLHELIRETARICAEELEQTGRLLKPIRLWEKLCLAHADWFEITELKETRTLYRFMLPQKEKK